ncbi:MAG: 1-acyl-sn-glycerol-3-phosphate acyltransferase [Clostridia bacterium]|nr:1-acyl-sn-glycerol-3-phosphate acyltransferase [Clostridia bacterium]
MKNFVRWFVKLTGFIPAYLLLKLKIYRSEGFRLPKRGRSAILICNHKTVLDVMLIMALFPFRKVSFLTGELMYDKGRLFSWFLKNIGCIRVDRNLSSDAGYLGEVTRAARSGELICIFPEAHFNRTSELLPFREGAAFIAGRLRLPVIPIYTDSVYRLFRRTRVCLGAPVDLGAPDASAPSSEWLSESTKKLRSEVQKLKNNLSVKKSEEDLARRESKFSRFFYRFTQFAISLFLFVAYRPKISYTDPKKQKRKLDGPVIVICNHIHFFDPPILCAVFYSSRLHMLTAGEIFETNAFVAWTLRVCNCIRLDRSGAVDTRSFRECITLLKAGEPIGLFPEGHLSSDDGIAPFMPGFLLFAAQTGAKVLPVCFSHNYRIFGKRLRVLIDTPVDVFPPDGRPSSDWMASEGEKLRARMIELHKMLNPETEQKD